MFFPERGPLLSVPQGPAVLWTPASEPDTLPIDLDTVKNWLNVPLEDNAFDPEKESLIYVAQEAIHDYCQLTVLTTTFVGTLPGFYDTIRITKRPFVSVTQIQYVDQVSGTITTLDPSTYLASPALQRCGVITRADGIAWPATAVRPDAVRITIQAGWDKPHVPKALQHAMLLTIAALDKARGDEGSSGGTSRSVYALKHQQASSLLPQEAKFLLQPFRLMTVVAS